jgi:DNA repair protein RecN (Recombination protein N)
LDAIDERLDKLYRLSKKYGATEEEMLSFLENARRELELITLSDERIEQLSAEEKTLLASCEKQAADLSAARKKSAKQLSAAVEGELAFLNMPSCRFVPQIVPMELCGTGADRVTFLISANAGEEPKPLNKVASGGELSRIMLALKNVLRSNSDPEVLIFDEIDTGVSGVAAQRVGEKLASLASERQVLCVTHLPQLAGMADVQFSIVKKQTRDGTFTEVNRLDAGGRRRELARLIGGETVTETTLSGASELMEAAEGFKAKLRERG